MYFNRNLLKIASKGLGALAGLYAAAWLSLFVLGGDQLIKADVLVVLGNEVLGSGQPSPRLAARLDRAFELYNQGWAPKIIVSGGVGKSGFSEALIMRDYLMAQGVPPADLVVDEQGINTRKTAEFTAGYLAGNGGGRALAVSQYFHVPRCRLALAQEGIEMTGGAAAKYCELRDIYSVAREMPGFVYYRLFH